MTGSPISFLALMPLITGPLPESSERSIVARLCNGGTITIPIEDDEQDPGTPCDMQACHAGTCRKRTG